MALDTLPWFLRSPHPCAPPIRTLGPFRSQRSPRPSWMNRPSNSWYTSPKTSSICFLDRPTGKIKKKSCERHKLKYYRNMQMHIRSIYLWNTPCDFSKVAKWNRGSFLKFICCLDGAAVPPGTSSKCLKLGGVRAGQQPALIALQIKGV